MKFATRFSRDAMKGLSFDKPSLVQPQFQRDTDINYMVRRYVAGDMSVFKPRYTNGSVDVSTSPDSLHACMNKVCDANTAWQDLPRSVRHSFGTIERFIAFLDQRAAQANVEQPADVKPADVKPADVSVTPDGDAKV